jgi:hypothetical protein
MRRRERRCSGNWNLEGARRDRCRRANRARRLAILGFAVTIGCLAGLNTLLAGPAAAEDRSPRLDQWVFKGSHNSFHKRPLIPFHIRHRVSHDSLAVQLDEHGVRALELDVHQNRKGEFEVYHIAIIDQRTHCKAFIDCLMQLRRWSELHPGHDLVQVWIEIKDFAGGEEIPSAKVLDPVIRERLGDRLLAPDDVRGGYPSLSAALKAEGWPRVDAVRGQFMFVLDHRPEILRDYTDGHRDVHGRAMFVDTPLAFHDRGFAAVTKITDPDSPDMPAALERGLLVSTTTCGIQQKDAACKRNKRIALERGAQILMDDYPRPVPGRSYFLDIDVMSIVAAKRGNETAAEPATARD